MSATDLLDLISKLKIPQMSTEASFDYLASLVGPNIKIRYEITDEKSTNEPNKSRFGHLNNHMVRRVLLTSKRNSGDFNSLLIQQCNGVVLEYPTWDVLSIPPPMFNPKFKYNQLSSKFAKYSVFEIKDGTTVTLYWCDGWCISSANGFQVNDYQWLGETTYLGAINELAAKYYPEFDFAKLDKTLCYTIGFRHHDFHPLQTDPQKMWFIQSYDLAQVNSCSPKLVPKYDLNIGFPTQVPIHTSANPIKWMMAENGDALSRYFTTSARRTEQSKKNGMINYGFILRGDFATHGKLSNIMLESTLLTTIRQLIYNLPKGKFATIVPAAAAERLKYTVLRAYLGQRTKYNFLNLFPQFTQEYKRYDDFFNKLCGRIFNAIINNTVRTSLITPLIIVNASANATKDKGLAIKIDQLAALFIPHIEKEINISPVDILGPGIILDFILDPKYIDIYFKCLVASGE